MPFNWTPEAERALLLYAVKAEDVKPNRDFFEAVASRLDGEVNGNACSQRFYKLKREAEALIGGADGSAPATPVVKKTKTPASKSTGKKRTSKQVEEKDDDDDNVEATPSKSKKIKKETKKATKKTVKKEDPQVSVEVEEDAVKEEAVEEDVDDGTGNDANGDDDEVDSDQA